MGECNFDLRRFIELNELNIGIYIVSFSTDITVGLNKLYQLNLNGTDIK